MRWVTLVALSLLLVSVSATAEDAAAPDRAARRAFVLAEASDRAFEYDKALAGYRAVVTIDPAHWFAATALARANALSRYEGQFSYLAELDRLRRDPARADDRNAVEAFAAASLPTFPPGRVRTEAQLFVAQAWLGRLGQPTRAASPALSAARETSDPELAAAGYDLAWTALRRVGDLERAQREIALDPRAPEPLRQMVRVALRRRALHRVALAIAVLTTLAGCFALGRAARDRRLSAVWTRLRGPRALLFLVVAPLGSAWLAEATDDAMSAPFLSFGVGLVLVHVFASLWGGAFGASRLPARLVGAVLALVFVVSSGYLALERSEAYGTSFLSGFGL